MTRTPMAFAPTAGGGVGLSRALELTVGEQVSAAAWKEALAIAQVFVLRVEGEEGFSSGFDVQGRVGAPCDGGG